MHFTTEFHFLRGVSAPEDWHLHDPNDQDFAYATSDSAGAGKLKRGGSNNNKLTAERLDAVVSLGFYVIFKNCSNLLILFKIGVRF